MSGLGTLEVAGRTLGRMLLPLGDALSSPSSARALLIDLGLRLPENTFTQPATVAAVDGVLARVNDLPGDLTAVADAIAAEVPIGILVAGERLVTTGQAIVTAMDAVATQLQGAAATVSALDPADLATFADEFPQRLLEYLAVHYLQAEYPALLGLLYVTGLAEREVERPDSTDPHRPATYRYRLRLDRLVSLLGDPPAALADVYGWGTDTLDAERMLFGLDALLEALGFLSVVDDSGDTPVLRTVGAEVQPLPDRSPTPMQATYAFGTSSTLSTTVPLGSGWTLTVTLGATLDAGTVLTVTPPLDVHVRPTILPVSGKAEVEFVRTNGPGGSPVILLGVAGGPRIEADAIALSAGVDLDWDLASAEANASLGAGLALHGGRVVIALGDADGFLRALLGEGFEIDASLEAGWTAEDGLFFEGTAGLDLILPVDLAIGPVRITTLALAVEVGTDALTVTATASGGARLGPIAVAVAEVGVIATVSSPDVGGNLGFADLALAFKPPAGLGLAIDAGVVKGGGYIEINAAGTEYAGVLELSFGPVSVKAIGILTTEVPGGGWALLLLVFSEFSAVQLGYGFTLNGVGGVIGLQHGVSTRALQSGLRTGVLDTVLFPPNPVADAPQLLSQLRAVFPVTPRALVVGPVLKLGWSTPPLITISLGLVLQFDDVLGAAGPPQLTRIVLLGQLKIQVPPDLGQSVPTVLKLLVDIAGSYELRERALAVDARLRDSHVAGIPLTGTLVVRARFGAEPAFILAVGGFHPRFTDLPPGLPPQDPVGFQLAYDIVTVRVVGYTAVTSNTFQIGAEASLAAAAAGFRIDAYLGFDALFVFTPRFQFVIDFRVGASIKYKSHSLASVDVRGILSGPARWVVTGHASFKVLFWRVGIDFEVAWGAQPAVPVATVDVRPLLVEALEEPANWQAELPAGGDALVTLRQPAIDGVLAHPLGELSVIQRVVPLGVDIDRVGTARPSDGNRFDITAVEIGAPGSPGFRSSQPTYRQEHFARGEYLDLSEEQKLSAPSFERFRAGAALSSDAYVAGGSQVAYDPDFETLYLDEPDERDVGRLPADLLTTFAHYGAAASAELRAGEKLAADRSLIVTVTDPALAVADAAGLTALTAEVFTSQTLAAQASAAAPGQTVAVELAELLGAP